MNEKMIDKKKISNLRIITLAYLVFSIFILLIDIFGKDTYYSSLYFWNADDYFMDFFNPLSFANSKNPYDFVDLGAIYPPLCYLIYKSLYVFFSDGFFLERFELRGDLYVYMLYIFLLIVCVVFISLVISNYLKAKNANNFEIVLIILLVISSYPFLYLIERGNILLMAFAFSLFFVLYYDSDNRVVAELALISLAIASALKIYPVVFFAVLLLNKIDIKRILRAVAYTVCTVFLPFLYYGKGSFISFYNNLKHGISVTEINVTTRIDLTSIIYEFWGLVSRVIHVEGVYGLENIKVIKIALLIVLLIGFFSLKQMWKKVLVLSLFTIIVPSFSFSYCGVMLLLPIVMLAREEEFKPINVLYILLFLGMMVVAPNIVANIRFLRFFVCLILVLLVDILVSIVNVIVELKKKRMKIRNE